MQTETLHWQIDGEWLTNFVRSWFWDEDKPYETCAELLGECIGTDDKLLKASIIQDIIEGRKKFVGVNEFELVDDNENVRPLALKIAQLKREKEIMNIREDIRVCGIKYVDPYSTVKSIKVAKERNIYNAEQCRVWFQYSDRDQIRGELIDEYAIKLDAAETPTAAGLWLFDEPELIYDATEKGKLRVGDRDFWDNIYELTKNRKGFEARSNFYKAKCIIDDSNEDVPKPQNFQNMNRHMEWVEMPKKDDKLSSWSGLISPDGNFYPADFGSHELVAYNILCNIGEELGETTEMLGEHKLWTGDIDDALSCIIEHGWVACRYLHGIGHYVDYKGKNDVYSRWKPTCEQKDILWKLVSIHHENVDTSIVPEVFF